LKFLCNIFAGQTRNELGRCEIAFLAFLNQHTNDQENIPLNEFFTQQKDNESDEEEFFHEVRVLGEISVHVEIM